MHAKPDPASTLFNERDIRTRLLALTAAKERVDTQATKATTVAIEPGNERERLFALLQLAEEAQSAANAAFRLAADARYLAGFLHGSGVRLEA